MSTKVPTTSAPPPTTTATTAAATTTTVEVVPEWVSAFPSQGLPGDELEICGVVQGARRLTVVVSDPASGMTWSNTGAVMTSRQTGQWCWTGRFPAETTDAASGEQQPIAPGVYDVDIEYDGTVIVHTDLEVFSEEMVAAMPPSQSPDDADRDGVVAEVAALPFYRRVNVQSEVVADEGVWMLTELSRAVEEESYATGCGIGDPQGVYPIDIICAVEYGEILLVADGAIDEAYPMPGAVPSWIHVTDERVYGGRIGDGALPDSTLVRIDRATLEATVVVIPSPLDGGTEWLPDWHLAPDSHRDQYEMAVHAGPGGSGTPVTSHIGTVKVDLEAIDLIIDVVTT